MEALTFLRVGPTMVNLQIHIIFILYLQMSYLYPLLSDMVVTQPHTYPQSPLNPNSSFVGLYLLILLNLCPPILLKHIQKHYLHGLQQSNYILLIFSIYKWLYSERSLQLLWTKGHFILLLQGMSVPFNIAHLLQH